jgi:hypothetical protein
MRMRTGTWMYEPARLLPSGPSRSTWNCEAIVSAALTDAQIGGALALHRTGGQAAVALDHAIEQRFGDLALNVANLGQQADWTAD